MVIRKRLNKYSIFLSMLCWICFFQTGFINSVLSVDGHYTVLWLAIISLLMSVIGLGGINNWITASKSIISVLLSGILVFVEVLLFVFSNVLSLN